MKAITKYLVMMIAMLAMSISLPSCGGDDPVPADAVVGTYSGTVQRMADGTEAGGYVTLTRASDTAVFLTLFKSETLNLNLNGNYELNVTESGSSYNLSTGSNYQISGSVTNGKMNLTVVINNKTYVFNGTK